ncbi:hypothetical protein BJY01DRAFT_15794 [Aspergillus pseudoustus]|uniref:Mid2 domain-containing protein n=1 Tax=Aspergillus pseudoustus TaxID=1810923 RepID=A0ABR4JL54_9EURO
MARFTALWLAYLALLWIPGTAAWTLVWRNDTTTAEVIDGQDEQNCTQIWHEAGEEFSFDPEGPWCIKFYHDAQCDRSNGIDCSGRLWKKDADQNISAFNVYSMPPASRTAFGFTSDTPTPTPTSTSTSTTTETSSPTPTADGAEEAASNDSNDLSGGAIAGIVIGVLIAVALLCAASFYLGRRTGKKAATAAAAAGITSTSPPQQPPSNPSPPSQTNTNTNSDQPLPPPAPSSATSATLYAPPEAAELPKPPVFETVTPYPQPFTYTQPPNGVRMIELPGQESGAELSNSRQVQEMGNRQIQELEGRGMEKHIP